MAKKYLKDQHRDLVVNIIDVLADLDPSKSNKFLTLLIKRFKEKPISEFKEYLYSEVSHVIGLENLRALKDFNDHLENNRARTKDISLLKNFGDVHEELVLAELKLKKCDLKKEVTTLYKDEEWLLVKPLSYEASKIYGSRTKWCTSSREDDKSFYNYSNDGVLIYVIKLGTNEKYGVHWYFEKNKSVEMSWWDVEDRKVDSLTLNVPSKITQIILDHYLTIKQPNSHYFKGKDKKRAEELKIKDNNCNVIPINLDPPLQHPHPLVPPDSVQPEWVLYSEDGRTTTTLNVEGLVNKSLEYTYMAQTIKKSLEGLDD